MSRNQNVGQNENLLIPKKSLKNVIKFKYLGITVKKQFVFWNKLRAD